MRKTLQLSALILPLFFLSCRKQVDVVPEIVQAPVPWARVDSLFGLRNVRVLNVQSVGKSLIITTDQFIRRIDPERSPQVLTYNLGWQNEKVRAVPFVSDKLMAYVATDRATLGVFDLTGAAPPSFISLSDVALSSTGTGRLQAQFDYWDFWQSAVVNGKNQVLLAVNFSSAPSYYYLSELDAAGRPRRNSDGRIDARFLADKENNGLIYGSFPTQSGFLVGYLLGELNPGAGHRLSQLHRVDAEGAVTYVLPNFMMASVSSLPDGIYAYGTPLDDNGRRGNDCFYRSTDDGRTWTRLDWPRAPGLDLRHGGLKLIGNRPVYIQWGVYLQEVDPAVGRVRELDRESLGNFAGISAIAEHGGYVYISTGANGGLYRRPLEDFFTYTTSK